MKIILASNSPRRQELLKGLDIDFEVRIVPDINESYPPELSPEAIPCYLSQKKASFYRTSMKADELVITADTIVELNGKILEKPIDREDALRMLQCLSGRKHQVITAVTLTTIENQKTFSEISSVDFAPLTGDEIEYYVDNYHPYDKAGGYGIQEWIGYIGVCGIEGSFYNVMGLPIQRLYNELKSILNDNFLSEAII